MYLYNKKHKTEKERGQQNHFNNDFAAPALFHIYPDLFHPSQAFLDRRISAVLSLYILFCIVYPEFISSFSTAGYRFDHPGMY